MTAKKMIKDYLAKGVRRLKNRKGFGVHSPFAYGIITEVIEEKIPYYAYQTMQRVYHKQAPIPFKVACLLLRLSNRFACRNIVEIGCDGGYTLLPLALVDSRNALTTVASPEAEKQTRQHLQFFKNQLRQVSFVSSLTELSPDIKADMLVINSLPAGTSATELFEWTKQHLSPNGIFFVHGIQPRRQLEELWDSVCDADDIEITMDLYDYGLAIRRPRFFKQHYIVSF